MAITLQHLHENNILHNDIKPANIVINEEGTPKLVDFGVSCKTLPANNKDCKIGPSQLGQCCTSRGGTLRYLAPELLLFRRRFPTSDIFSLGVTIYTLFNENIIWYPDLDSGVVTPEMITKAIRDKSIKPDQLRLTQPLDMLVNGMTRKNLLMRISTKDILNILQKHNL